MLYYGDKAVTALYLGSNKIGTALLGPTTVYDDSGALSAQPIVVHTNAIAISVTSTQDGKLSLANLKITKGDGTLVSSTDITQFMKLTERELNVINTTGSQAAADHALALDLLTSPTGAQVIDVKAGTMSTFIIYLNDTDIKSIAMSAYLPHAKIAIGVFPLGQYSLNTPDMEVDAFKYKEILPWTPLDNDRWITISGDYVQPDEIITNEYCFDGFRTLKITPTIKVDSNNGVILTNATIPGFDIGSTCPFMETKPKTFGGLNLQYLNADGTWYNANTNLTPMDAVYVYTITNGIITAIISGFGIVGKTYRYVDTYVEVTDTPDDIAHAIEITLSDSGIVPLKLKVDSDMYIHISVNGQSNMYKCKAGHMRALDIRLPLASAEKKIKITKGCENVTHLETNSRILKSVDVTYARKLNKVVMYDTTLSDLIFTSLPSLQYVHIHNSPLASDMIKLQELAAKLPDRNNKAFGSIIIDDANMMAKVRDDFEHKDWLFGSALQYKSESKAKMHYNVLQMQAPDIWESLDYGEGINVAVLDNGFSLNMNNITYANVIARYNPTDQPGDANNPVPVDVNPQTAFHGSFVLSIIAGNGAKDLYGIAPKVNIYLGKASGTQGVMSTYPTAILGKFQSYPIDVYNMSLGFNQNDPNFEFMVRSTLSTNQFICSGAGNDGDGNPETDELFYPACYEGVLSVASFDKYNLPDRETSSNIHVGISSYGVSVPAESDLGQIGAGTGTSFASPNTTGAVALLIKYLKMKLGRKPTNHEVMHQIKKRTIAVEYDKRISGAGIVNLMAYNKEEARQFVIKTNKANSIEFAITTNEDATITYTYNKTNHLIMAKKGVEQKVQLTLPNDETEKVIDFVSNYNAITKLVANDCGITGLNVTDMDNLNRIHIHTNPIVTDDAALKEFVSTLQDRTEKGYGSIIIGNKAQQDKVELDMLKKDWAFGSMITYTEPDKISWFLPRMGIPDIWESADYGEGVGIAICDTQFDMTTPETDKARMKGAYNLSGDNRPADDPTGEHIVNEHGTSVYNVIAAKGAKFYGVSYKSDFYPIRLTYKNFDNSNSPQFDYGHIAEAFNLNLKENKFDIYTSSLGGPYTPNNALDMYKAVFDSNNGRGTAMFFAAGNEPGDGNPNTTEEKTYPGAFPGAMSVTAINEYDYTTSFSRSHDRIAFTTYGNHIPTCSTTENGYIIDSGTSISCPIAAGAAALLFNLLKKKLGRKPTVWEVYAEIFKRMYKYPPDDEKNGVRNAGAGRFSLLEYNPDYLKDLYRITKTEYGKPYDKVGKQLLTFNMGMYFYFAVKGIAGQFTVTYNGDAGYGGHMGTLIDQSRYYDIKSDTEWNGLSTLYVVNGEEYITHFKMDGMNVRTFDASIFPVIEHINIDNAPLFDSESATASLINSLPDRTGKTAGSLVVGPKKLSEINSTLLRSKNWVTKTSE